MRQRFAGNVETNALRVRLGTWRWTAEHPQPTWATLQKAKFWVEVRYKALREVLAEARPVAEITASSQLELPSVRLMGADGTGRWVVQAFSAGVGTPVPEAALDKQVRLVLVDAEGVDQSGGPTNSVSPSHGCLPSVRGWSEGFGMSPLADGGPRWWG
jgi:hypothetical protein